MNDYTSMVETLRKPITPQLRKAILERLTIMNNRLIEDTIDLDSLLDDMEPNLDQKLDRIAHLHNKILSDRAVRKGYQKK